MATLFRPVGLRELSLLWDLEWREFPPRLPHQPIFYPVRNREYAQEIASGWNVKDEASGYSAYVTEFSNSDTYLRKFDPKIVGTRNHVEYWIPSEELASFNQHILNTIRVTYAYFDESFRGYVPEKFGLRGKTAVEQFVTLARTLGYGPMDFVHETALNCKAIYINSWFWAQRDFANDGVNADEKWKTVEALQRAWKSNEIKIPLPAHLFDNWQ